MKHYYFDQIKERGSCIDYVEQVHGAKVNNGRCAAIWRGGDGDTNVAIERDKWYDHVAKQGGGLIELCAVARFGDISKTDLAQEFLGEWLGLTPMTLRKSPGFGSSRYDELIAEGYTETARYNYIDLEGTIQYYVVRLEHPEKHKEFLQGANGHWGISGIKSIPYNWAMVNKSEWCVIVEGEKDVETLKKDGVPATTNSGGAKKWHPEFAEYFKGKKVFILPDNDEVGQQHGEMIARDLCKVAACVKVYTCSKLPKGDVTDYFQKEGGDWKKLFEQISAAPVYEAPAELCPEDAAKEANKRPFQNFTMEEDPENPKVQQKVPRQINALIEELHTRLQGAPFCVGDVLFDQDKKTGKIRYFYKPADIFCWIAQTTNTLCDWCKIDGATTKEEFFSALKNSAAEYNAVSAVPDYPPRKDVFYTHPQLPKPSEQHQVFQQFLNFFNPCDEVNKSLLAAFIMAPIFYEPSADRPLWIIDSPDGQGAGKSKVPEMVSRLYGASPIDVTLHDLEYTYPEVIKRIISTSGRDARILRLDNLTGTLRSPNLATLITTRAISGRPSYGRGEEKRPNNLTYVVTVNGATVDTDIASRAYYINDRQAASL